VLHGPFMNPADAHFAAIGETGDILEISLDGVPGRPRPPTIPAFNGYGPCITRAVVLSRR
jgi:hypothetical protein